MIHGSLFSGIGGFDLAAEWMGWKNAFHCEYNPFCQHILKHYWPYAESYTDIRKTDFTVWRNRIDILTGGFPCQPYSTAGKRKGKDDERHLWPEMLRAIRESRPRWVVGENVRGLVSWSRGLVFEEVQAELEAEGYEVQPFILPAASVGAPHERYRTWFVAYSGNAVHQEILEDKRPGKEKVRSKSSNQRQAWRPQNGQRVRVEPATPGNKRATPYPNNPGSNTPGHGTDPNGTAQGEKRREPQRRISGFSGERTTPHPVGQGLPQRLETGNGGTPRTAPARKELERNAATRDWSEFSTQSPVLPGDDGLPAPLDGYSVSGWYKEFISGPGNAVVPQVVYRIFKAIEVYEGIISPSK